jgi:hypothetical protein
MWTANGHSQQTLTLRICCNFFYVEGVCHSAIRHRKTCGHYMHTLIFETISISIHWFLRRDKDTGKDPWLVDLLTLIDWLKLIKYFIAKAGKSLIIFSYYPTMNGNLEIFRLISCNGYIDVLCWRVRYLMFGGRDFQQTVGISISSIFSHTCSFICAR